MAHGSYSAHRSKVAVGAGLILVFVPHIPIAVAWAITEVPEDLPAAGLGLLLWSLLLFCCAMLANLAGWLLLLYDPYYRRIISTCLSSILATVLTAPGLALFAGALGAAFR